MNLKELRYVVAVAQERNFGRAAARCFVSQPALSIGVLKLEEELGVRVFERGKSEVSVTPAGGPIVEQAQRVLEEVARIRELARQGQNQLVGTLRLGVIHTVAPYLLPELVPALHQRAPEMPLEIEENITDNLESQLRSGRLDVIVVALPFEVPGVATVPLYEEPFRVVVPAAHPWAKRKRVEADELGSQNCILLQVGHCFRNQVLEACPELNRASQSLTHSNSLETVRNMVASGLGVSVLPASALTPKYHSKLVVAVPFAAPPPARRVALAYRRSFPRPAVVELLRDCVAKLELPHTRAL